MCSSHAHTHVLLLVHAVHNLQNDPFHTHTHSYVLPIQVEKREEDSSLMQLKEEVRERERKGSPFKP